MEAKNVATQQKRDKKKDKKDKRDKREKRKAAKDETVQTTPESSKKRPREAEAETNDSNKKAKLAEEDSTSKPKKDPVAASKTVTVSEPSFQPMESFSETGFSKDLLETTKNFLKPTLIQSHCWPVLIAKRDIIGIAETGSGKTLAFGLPGLAHVAQKTNNKSSMLVVAPTRELAQQSFDVLTEAGKKSGIKTVCIYGGVAKFDQIKALRGGAQIIVGCPGRILDLANEGNCDLSEVDYLVLDEADRMLDMGFERDIRTIFSYIKKVRQTAMFSATWPKGIQQLASEFLTKPVRVTIGSADLSANVRVQQIVEVIEMESRDARLFELLRQYHNPNQEKVLIFALYKKEAARLEVLLNRKGWNCASIHGDKTTQQRGKALDDFKKGNPPLLIATDVAARGLDIPQVAYVINYSFPLTVEDYVHRIGRTGRAGRTGISHTFFHKFDKGNSGELIAVLRKAGQDVPEELKAFGTFTKKKEPKLTGKLEANVSTGGHIEFDSDSE